MRLQRPDYLSHHRQAEPDPWREMIESSEGDAGSSYRSAIALTRAANPAALEAKPAAVGKLFSDTIFSGYVDSFGRLGFAFSSASRCDRRAARHAWVLGVSSD